MHRRVWLYRSLYFLFFGSGAMMSPFLSLYLRNHGLTGTELGILWAVGPFVTVLSQPLWGLWTDARGKRPVFLGLLAVNSFLALVYLPATRFWQFFVIAIALALFRSPVGVILDSFVLDYLEENRSRSDYGKLRLWGAVGWSSLSYVAGRIVSAVGLPVIFVLNSIGNLGTFLVGLGVQDTKGREIRKVDFRQLGVLLRDRRLVVFLGSIFLLQVATGSMLSFYPIYLDAIGAKSGLIGTAFLLEGLSEIPIFFLSGWFIGRAGAKWGVAIGALTYGIRLTAYSFIRTPILGLMFQLLHGLSFSLFFASAVNYVDSLVPPHLRTTGQTLLWATYWGIGSIVGNTLAGFLFDTVGVFSLFRIGGAIAFVSALLVALLVVHPSGNREMKRPA